MRYLFLYILVWWREFLDMIPEFFAFIKRYFWNVVIGFDQLANAIAFGDPDETISSRIGKHHKKSWLYRILNRIEKNHCELSREDDEGKDALLK